MKIIRPLYLQKTMMAKKRRMLPRQERTVTSTKVVWLFSDSFLMFMPKMPLTTPIKAIEKVAAVRSSSN